jgi:hypothetical protein
MVRLLVEIAYKEVINQTTNNGINERIILIRNIPTTNDRNTISELKAYLQNIFVSNNLSIVPNRYPLILFHLFLLFQLISVSVYVGFDTENSKSKPWCFVEALTLKGVSDIIRYDTCVTEIYREEVRDFLVLLLTP